MYDQLATILILYLLQSYPLYILKYVMGSFKNHVDIILLFFDHPPTLVDSFYVLNVDKNGKF